MKLFLAGVFVGLMMGAAVVRAARVAPEIQSALNQCEAEKVALLEYAGDCLIACGKPWPAKVS
jgi:hypothetical protein